MRKTNILVTGVGGDIAQGIIKCLKETRDNLYLLGVDIDPYAAGGKMASKFILAPAAAEEEKYLEFIKYTVNKYKVDYVFPSTEPEIIVFHKHRDYFSERKIEIFINTPFIIDTFFDKYQTALFLKRIGLAYPSTFLINEYNGQLRYPLIIKPRISRISKQIIKIANTEEFKFYKNRISEAIVQEYLGDEDEEYTTCVFSDGRRRHSITFKRRLGYGGLSKKVELVINKEINALADAIAKNCNLRGSINIQSRKTPRGFVPFEINPRFSSTVYFRHCFGFQDVKWWLELFEKKPVTFPSRYKKGIGVRMLDEVFFDAA